MGVKTAYSANIKGCDSYRDGGTIVFLGDFNVGGRTLSKIYIDGSFAAEAEQGSIWNGYPRKEGSRVLRDVRFIKVLVAAILEFHRQITNKANHSITLIAKCYGSALD